MSTSISLISGLTFWKFHRPVGGAGGAQLWPRMYEIREGENEVECRVEGLEGCSPATATMSSVISGVKMTKVLKSSRRRAYERSGLSAVYTVYLFLFLFNIPLPVASTVRERLPPYFSGMRPPHTPGDELISFQSPYHCYINIFPSQVALWGLLTDVTIHASPINQYVS